MSWLYSAWYAFQDFCSGWNLGARQDINGTARRARSIFQ